MHDAIESILRLLQPMPLHLGRVVTMVTPELFAVRGSRGSFALIEHLCHLADLETEGFGLRIDRILAESDPFLPDFNGEEIAAERHYLQLDAEDALMRFTVARLDNIAKFRSIRPEQWERKGFQEKVGTVVLASLPRLMVQHDSSHRQELAVLLDELHGGNGVLPLLTHGDPFTSTTA